MNILSFKLTLMIANLSSWSTCKTDIDEKRTSELEHNLDRYQKIKSCERIVGNHGEEIQTSLIPSHWSYERREKIAVSKN